MLDSALGCDVELLMPLVHFSRCSPYGMCLWVMSSAEARSIESAKRCNSGQGWWNCRSSTVLSGFDSMTLCSCRLACTAHTDAMMVAVVRCEAQKTPAVKAPANIIFTASVKCNV